MVVLLKNPDSVREKEIGLWMCKHKLEQTPFCSCHNLNPNTLSSSKLLPRKQRSTQFIFLVYGCANANLNKFLFALAKTPIQAHFHLHSCYPQTKNVPPRPQKQNCTNCVFRTVHVQCTHSARYSARHSARPQNSVNTTYLPQNDAKTKKQYFCIFL